MASKKNKAGKVLLIVLASILAAAVLFVTGVRIYFRGQIHDYYKVSKKAFRIPGVMDDLIAQGITYDGMTDCFYITGYTTDGSACPLYTVSRKTGKTIKEVRLADMEGNPFVKHAGGLSVYDGDIYIAGGSDDCFFVFDKNEIDEASDKAVVSCRTRVELKSDDDDLGSAFTQVHAGLIYTGEFYREPQYPVRKEHTVKTADGENHALMGGFRIENGEAVPVVAYSIPSQIQGVEFDGERIYTSSSWGPAFSYIDIYDETQMVQQGTISLLGREVPLYVLDSRSLTEHKRIAPMAEEIIKVDGLLYTMCEAASMKYKFGFMTGAQWCYASRM